MKDYCLSRIKDGMYTFPCPGEKCKVIWDFVLVRHVASNCLDNETRSKIEKELSEISISQGRGFQQCPGCHIWCIPINKGDICLRCPVCSKTRSRPYDFCWACQQQWRGTGVRYCGNEGCDGKDPRIKILHIAAENPITIGNIHGCPSIRACPKCGLLIRLTEGCCQITCWGCKAQFCFICLRLRKTLYLGLLPHGCWIAPVQEILSDPPWEDLPTPPPTPRPAAENGGGCVIL